MSKRDLKKYLAGLEKEQVETQLLDLYDKFPDVKKYYDFVFNPREDKLVQDAKAKISNEYFPIKTKRAKLRRSVAQKLLKNFLVLGVDPFIILDVMLFNIETAQKYSAKKEMRYQSFYTSMINSFRQAAEFAENHGITAEFLGRMEAIATAAKIQRWENAAAFQSTIENLYI